MNNDPKILFATRANTLQVAAEDIQAFAARPGCAVNMCRWNNAYDDTCFACQAGAVAIQSLGVPFNTNIFDDTPYWVREIFRLLNQVRQGDLCSLLFAVGVEGWSTITYERCAEVLEMYGVSRKRSDVRRDLIEWLKQDYVPYEESPEKYVDWLHSVANVLDELEK